MDLARLAIILTFSGYAQMMEPSDQNPATRAMISGMNETYRGGARGLVIGEIHNDRLLPQLVGSALKDMKAQGVNTLYVEYVPSDRADQLNKALSGDSDARLAIRGHIERGFGGYGGGQERYDLIAAAHQAGMRVVPIDLPSGQMYRDHDYMNPEAALDEKRLPASDPHIASTVQAADDGGRFIVMIGAAHTYKAPGREGVKDDIGMVMSRDGGLDARLNAMGIPTRSMDTQFACSASVVISGPNDATQSDYGITLPVDGRAFEGVYSAHFLRGGLDVLTDGYREILSSATDPDLRADVNSAMRAVDNFRAAMYDDPQAQTLGEAGMEIYATGASVLDRMGMDHQDIKPMMVKHLEDIDSWVGRGESLVQIEQSIRTSVLDNRSSWNGEAPFAENDGLRSAFHKSANGLLDAPAGANIQPPAPPRLDLRSSPGFG